MNKRQKDLKVMAEAADLTPLEFSVKRARQFLMCRAPNGVTREFSVSIGASSDAHGDLNEQGRMKRFARENPAPAATPAIQKPPKEEKPMKTMHLQPAPATSKPLPTERMTVIDLGPREFFMLTEWLRAQDLQKVSSFDALALLAGQHLGQPVDETSMRSALEMTRVKEPDHWGEPTDAQTILVREVGLLLKGLGQEPTPAFKKLHGLLLP